MRAADHLEPEAAAWDALLAGQGKVTVPARMVRRVIIDLENYYCAYTDLVTTGGHGSSVRSWWAESLYLLESGKASTARRVPKGRWNEIEGRVYIGIGDTFEPDGVDGRRFDTLWWEAGRYTEFE